MGLSTVGEGGAAPEPDEQLALYVGGQCFVRRGGIGVSRLRGRGGIGVSRLQGGGRGRGQHGDHSHRDERFRDS